MARDIRSTELASIPAGRAGFINMKRARTLGLNVPPTVLATSDQAIE